MLFFYQARCALCPNDHRSHIFPFLLCYVRMMSAHSVLHEAFAQRLSGMFFPIENALCETYLSTPSPKRAKSPLVGSSGHISLSFWESFMAALMLVHLLEIRPNFVAS